MSHFNASEAVLDFKRGFTIDFDMISGISKSKKTTMRYLSDMTNMFADKAALEKMLNKHDTLVYEFHEMPAPVSARDLAFGCSTIYPGKVGDEYFMTKGHFHTILDTDFDTAEVYYCLNGHGYMLLENPEGDWSAQELFAGHAVYVPKRYAHRCVNVHPTESLLTFFVSRGDAGHNYGAIEAKGYRKLIVESGGKPAIKDNPLWQA